MSSTWVKGYHCVQHHLLSFESKLTDKRFTIYIFDFNPSFPPAKSILSASKGSKKTYLVFCLGHCRDIGVHLEVKSGDADLYAREDSPPVIENSNCAECPLCKSRQSTREDKCSDISTVQGESFYLMVTAHKAYRGATIKISGYNLKEVRDSKNEEDQDDEEPATEVPETDEWSICTNTAGFVD